jgi:hypothetical protein
VRELLQGDDAALLDEKAAERVRETLHLFRHDLQLAG